MYTQQEKPTSKNKEEKKIRPLIKWPGGKYDEFRLFSHMIPAFANYYEPFAGGAGVYFALQPKQQAFLNDKSADLYRFYSLINLPSFHHELYTLAAAWDAATQLTAVLQQALVPLFTRCLQQPTNFEVIKSETETVIEQVVRPGSCILLDKEVMIKPGLFLQQLKHSLSDKIRRICNIAAVEKNIVTLSDLPHHIEAAIKSCLYMCLRWLYNEYVAGKLHMSKHKAAATWYFVREFCYASMFRFNNKGAFNIPYGGIAYNKKNFRDKVDHICSAAVQQQLSNTSFYNMDFEAFLQHTTPGESDFVFVDPPYDSEFSSYDQNAFTKADQQRLRDCLFQLPSKWMMVIKETAFIRELYTNDACSIINFDKTYTYNVRGRNNRAVSHLIIVNY